MYGFTVVYGNITDLRIPSYKNSLRVELPENKAFFFGYTYFEKFGKDKIFKEDKDFVVGIDGVVFNLQMLKNHYGVTDYFDLLLLLYKKNNIQFVSELKGEFNGFVFDKNTRELFFFNNKTGTKQIFYTTFREYTIISQSINDIIHYKESLNLESLINRDAIYSMLTFGGMIENQTLIDSVFKLQGGRYLLVKDSKIVEKEYFSFSDVNHSIYSRKEAIEKIDEVIREALKLQYEKDVEYGYPHLSTLSGGLDSRVNLMVSQKLGYSNKTFCFSQSGYLDDIISRKISSHLQLDYEFIPLNGGIFMKDVKENVTINNGMQIFTGAAHYRYAINQMNIATHGLMHTGQIGDGIFGGLLEKKREKGFLAKKMSSKFVSKLVIDQNLYSKYKNEEVFKLYQNVFNLTHFGSFVTESFQTYLTSPFLDDDVISLALSIDPKLREHQDIYIDWICEKHPEMTRFIWERTGFKPNRKWKTTLSKYTRKIRNEYLIYTNKQEKISMTPEDYWLNNTKIVKEFYSNFFEKYSSLLISDKEIFNDINTYYTEGSSAEKAIVLTILEVMRKFKLKV